MSVIQHRFNHFNWGNHIMVNQLCSGEYQLKLLRGDT